MTGVKKNYLHSIEYFRGIAIFFIVTGHCYAIGGWKIDTIYEKTLLNILTGGTTLFVFISGLLFHHVYYPVFAYKNYLVKKFKNIGLPYIFLSVMALIFYWGIRNDPPHSDLIFSGKPGFLHEYVYPVFKYLWTGRIMNAYWYIPFIAVFYIFSPLYVAFIKLNVTVRFIIFFVFYIISHLVQRPIDNLNPLHSALYFISVYMLGILVSIHKDKIYLYLKGKEFLIMLFVFIFAAFDSYLTGSFGTSHKQFFLLKGADIMLFQKTALCFFFLIFLARFENKDLTILRILAKASFAVYFLHSWVLNYFMEMPYVWEFPKFGFFIFILSSLVGIFGSMLLAIAIRKILKQYSRFVIGW